MLTASLSSAAYPSWTRHSHDANFSSHPLKPASSFALLFQVFHSGIGAAGIHFVSMVNFSEGPLLEEELCPPPVAGTCIPGIGGTVL